MRPIKEAGIYQMSAAEYHADPCATPSLSASLAKVIVDQSPLHAWTESRSLNPNYQHEEKEVFDIGSAVHALLLEGEDRMVPIPFSDYRKKEAQELRDAARAAGKHPVLEARYQDVLTMRDVALRAIADCSDLGGITLADGKPEQVLIWQEKNGVWCRARLDWIWNQHVIVWDYKSTTDATPRAFSRHIAKMGYHIQDEIYSRGVEAVFGRRPKFVFIAQETKAPYACSFHGVAPSLRAVASKDVDYALDTWARCVATSTWPGHDKRIHWAEAMPWQIDEAEERGAGIEYDPSKLWRKPLESDLVA